VLARLLIGLAAGLAACGGGSGGGQIGTPSSFVPSTEFTYPASIQGSPAGFYVDENSGGAASGMQLIQVSWGRLVDVYDRNLTSGVETLRFRNFVIGEEIQTDGIDFRLDTNSVTQAQSLVILHAYGGAEFESALSTASSNLGPVNPKDDLPGTLPPFSFVPRNAAIVLRFDDLLDPGTITSDTIKVLTGTLPQQPYEARIVADPNFGGLVGSGANKQFRPTRVIIDTAVSELDAGSANPPLPVNVIGLPPAVTTFQPSASVRIATKVDFSAGQFQVLTNTSGHAIDPGSSNPVDIGVATLDVVRAIRTGGKSIDTGDTNNGFLLDLTPPQVLGVFQVSVATVLDDTTAGSGNYLVDLMFGTTSCAQNPSIGDILELPNALAIVTALSTPPALGVLNDVQMRLLTGTEAALKAGGQATYKTAYEPSEDAAQAACFIGFFPGPGTSPASKVDPAAQVVVRFSEPIDPTSAQPFDSLTVTRAATNIKGTDIVVSRIEANSTLDELAIQPILPFHHLSGTSEQYFVNVLGGAKGLTDLAGNPIAAALPQVAFTLNNLAPTGKRGQFALRFNANSDLEEGTGATATNVLPELRDGGIVRDLPNGLIRPRSVSRFKGVLDRSPGTLGTIGFPIFSDGTVSAAAIPTPFSGGIREPLNHLGSRMMTVWRYCDMGMQAKDEATINIDIEGMSWSPFNGNVIGDYFPNFQMEFSHSRRFPDEYVDPTGSPLLGPCPNGPIANTPFSGLVSTSFDDNQLSDVLNPKTVVHPKGLGYLVDPVDKFNYLNSVFMPYPLNTGDPSTLVYWTWRDTAVLAVGGADNAGIEPGIVVYGVSGENAAGALYCGTGAAQLNGLVAESSSPTNPDGDFPSIYLPLLMDFKCFPDGSGVSLNALDGSCAADPSLGTGFLPLFRVFSSGGSNTAGALVQKFPDQEQVPSGGFNDNTAYGPEGAQTPSQDNFRYNGLIDFVVRVTRVPTIWFDAGAQATFATPVVLPDNADQPSGTSIVLAFRSATAIANSVNNFTLRDANCLNAYGDEPTAGSICLGNPQGFVGTENASITFTGGNKAWKDTIQQLNGSRFFQMRLTFVNNPQTIGSPGLSPVLTALGVAWTLP
jgi:hypothetical protein